MSTYIPNSIEAFVIEPVDAEVANVEKFNLYKQPILAWYVDRYGASKHALGVPVTLEPFSGEHAIYFAATKQWFVLEGASGNGLESLNDYFYPNS